MLRIGRVVENIRLLFFNKSMDVYVLFIDKGKILVKFYFLIE